MKKNIGKHLTLDVTTKSNILINDMERIYDFLLELSLKINMTLVYPPIVAKFPFKSNGSNAHISRPKDDHGISGTCIWQESHASIHTWTKKDMFSFDAFSCKEFDESVVINLAKNFFDVKEINGSILLRFANRQPEFSSFTEQVVTKTIKK